RGGRSYVLKVQAGDPHCGTLSPKPPVYRLYGDLILPLGRPEREAFHHPSKVHLRIGHKKD
ncbi:MAG TPA: hypothetical protein VN872_05080, partial [Candidatus Acidoferrum sp.]|nr:hypothetical protein [Candidatus Acidoferrum sp.]